MKLGVYLETTIISDLAITRWRVTREFACRDAGDEPPAICTPIELIDR